MGTQVPAFDEERKPMRESKLAILLLMLGCFWSVKKVDGYEEDDGDQLTPSAASMSKFMLDSASVNSISSIPSPVYQCKKALRRNIAVKYSATLLNISWIAVELPKKLLPSSNPWAECRRPTL